MNNYFSIGELSKLQNISRQTLIFYDKIGLFTPAYINPENGYRYYNANQLDYLDTICIMKKIGFSLEEIKEHMKNYTLDSSVIALRKQLTIIQNQIHELELIKTRVEHRCQQLEQSANILDNYCDVFIENVNHQYILLQEVDKPYTMKNISIATKNLFVRSYKEHLPVFFQSGASVPLKHALEDRCIEATYCFLPIEKTSIKGVKELPAGKCVTTYHKGDYQSIGNSYKRIIDYCRENKLEIISDSYEFAINDYLSTGDESEYITKIMFYIR
ncbi:MAG: MerR family transcriptional regulator [Solobacterium sp.]|nr:MerR family transcriptional regulator [Solobacterium sp.]MDY4493764.1 MerR family transcriptional regulator [Erysipelotrichaceae bacterium]